MLTDRQKGIVETSLEIISTSGIQGLTIKNLAKRIGITEPAIYRHYENKISILLTILDYFKDSSDLMFSNQFKSEDGPLKKIESIFEGLFEEFEKNPSLVSVIFSEEIFRNEKDLQEKIAEIMDRNIKAISALVAEGQARGEINPNYESKYITIIIVGSLRMMVKRWQVGDKSLNNHDEVRNLFATLRKLITE